MTFDEALNLLIQGNRIISKEDKDIWEYQWLSLNDEGQIMYMNEPWKPSPQWLLDYMNDEWINVETDPDYINQNES